MEKIITGCIDCPMCDMNDMAPGFTCRVSEYPNNQIAQSKKWHLPMTPKWCPVKKEQLIIKYDTQK